MRIALDTNAYSGFAKGDPGRVRAIRGATELFVPLIVLGELRAGFEVGAQSVANESQLARFLTVRRVSILVPDESTKHEYARLYGQLRRQGTPIPTNDLWIASLVVQHGLTLCTADGHFSYLPQISVC